MVREENQIKEKPMTISEVKDTLEKMKKKQTEELNYTQEVTLKYAQRFAKLDIKKSKKLLADLTKKPWSIEPEIAVQIVNILPKSIQELKVFFDKKIAGFPDNEYEKIVKHIKTFITA
ncbi:MAG: hypothetical protein ACTSUV_03875 [Candidatus Ranarchaeia archaeon]